MPYAVQTEVFEGPFDVLLRLILDQEVDLYEISLTNIVDAYLTEMERILSGAANDGNNSGVDLELATEFLLIAATLVELKTRRLLPDRTDGDLDESLGSGRKETCSCLVCSSARPSKPQLQFLGR